MVLLPEVVKKSGEAGPSPAARDGRQPSSGVSPADLFRRTADFDSFRRALRSLNGAFPFSSADMIELGKAYFERFPDREQDRNMEEVRLGYAVVRAAIIEKVVLDVDPSRRDCYRAIFGDSVRIGPEAEALLPSTSLEEVLADHDALAASLAALKAVIDEIPKGMIKERFIGGISYFFNILFAVKMSLGSRLPR